MDGWDTEDDGACSSLVWQNQVLTVLWSYVS